MYHSLSLLHAHNMYPSHVWFRHTLVWYTHTWPGHFRDGLNNVWLHSNQTVHTTTKWCVDCLCVDANIGLKCQSCFSRIVGTLVLFCFKANIYIVCHSSLHHFPPMKWLVASGCNIISFYTWSNTEVNNGTGTIGPFAWACQCQGEGVFWPVVSRRAEFTGSV